MIKQKDHGSFKGSYGICTNNSDVHAGAVLGTPSYSGYSKIVTFSVPELLLTV